MDLLHLVDRFEELVGTAQKMPIGSRVMIDRRRLLDIVDQMRVVIPQEVRDARDIVERRDELRREAEEEARMIVARAEEQAARLVDQHAVTVAAREHADRVAAEAQERLEERIGEANEDVRHRLEESRRLAGEQMAEADGYSAELLQRLERQLEAFVRSVRAGLSQLEPAQPEGPAEPAEDPQPALAEFDVAVPEPAERPEPAPALPLATIAGLQQPPAPTPVSVHAPAGGARGAIGKLDNLLTRTLRNGDAVADVEGAPVIDDLARPRLDDEGGRKD